MFQHDLLSSSFVRTVSTIASNSYTLFPQLIILFSSANANKGQVPGCVLRPPEAGAGEGVPLQPLHHHQEEGRARKHDRTFRETGIKQGKHNAFEAQLKRVTTKIFLFYFALTYYF